MKQYRICLRDADGRIENAYQIFCRDDLDALDEGKRRGVENAVEIWDGKLLVARVKAGNAPLTAQDRYSL